MPRCCAVWTASVKSQRPPPFRQLGHFLITTVLCQSKIVFSPTPSRCRGGQTTTQTESAIRWHPAGSLRRQSLHRYSADLGNIADAASAATVMRLHSLLQSDTSKSVTRRPFNLEAVSHRFLAHLSKAITWKLDHQSAALNAHSQSAYAPELPLADGAPRPKESRRLTLYKSYTK